MNKVLQKNKKENLNQKFEVYKIKYLKNSINIKKKDIKKKNITNNLYSL